MRTISRVVSRQRSGSFTACTRRWIRPFEALGYYTSKLHFGHRGPSILVFMISHGRPLGGRLCVENRFHGSVYVSSIIIIKSLDLSRRIARNDKRWDRVENARTLIRSVPRKIFTVKPSTSQTDHGRQPRTNRSSSSRFAHGGIHRSCKVFLASNIRLIAHPCSPSAFQSRQ
jgi:hypothetical protein